jgi:predicted permease
MDWIRILLSRCVALFRGPQLDADLDEELRAHLDLAIADHRRNGMNEAEARATALREFGGVTQHREAYRMQRGLPWIAQIMRDIRFAVRQLRKAPGFTLAAILTLACGIGAAASVFSVVDAVLLKPFAFHEPDRLVVMREREDETRSRQGSFPDNYRHYLRLKHDSKTLEDAAIFSEKGVSVSPAGKHPRIVGAVVSSPNLFHVLGVQPMLGRGFVDADAEKGNGHVVVLSYEGWRTLFAGQPNVIGQMLGIGGSANTVVGVLPPAVSFPHIALATTIPSPEGLGNILLYQPLVPAGSDLKTDLGNFNYRVIARLRPGVSIAQATAELEALQKAYSLAAYLPIHLGIALTPLTKDAASGVSGELWLLFAAVATVLLIGCVNLANLQLARALNAERETAVRAALGASRFQLFRARLTECLVLSTIGGIAGTVLANAGVRALLAFAPPNVPRLDEVQVNLPVLLFAAGISIAAALVFGILPALRSLRVSPQAALQANSTRAANSRTSLRARTVMVTLQVTCTVVLLLVTGLTLRSFSRLMHQDRGFDSNHVTLAQVDLYAPQFGDSNPSFAVAKLSFADRALAAINQLPGVQLVGLTSVTPLTGETWIDELSRPDHPVPEAQRPLVNVRFISPGYLPAMRVPLIEGRNLSPGDRAHPAVVLISQRTAHEAFPGEDPIGKKINNSVASGDQDHALSVIGVVADTHINGLKDTAAMVYVPYWDYTPWTISFLVRSAQSSTALAPEIRRAIWQIDPQVAIPVLKSMDDQLSESVATDRFQTIVLSSFGAAALLLALLGVYGVLAYSVSLRRQEFGIRIALGSGKSELVGLVLRQAAVPVLAGTCAGVVLGVFALRAARSLLYQTPALDPLSFAGALLLLLAAAAMAAILPARRAASVDPIQALRIE